MEVIRAFVAIELPDEVKTKLDQLEARLRTGDESVKWVAPEGIHLTLKFLGDVAADRVGEITKAIGEAAAEIPPFQLEVKGLGAFPNPRRVQVVWAGMTGQLDVLSRLHHNIQYQLALLDFPEEEREFTPHLTIARMRNGIPAAARERMGDMISRTSFEGGNIMVESVSLMKSHLTPKGAIYTRMASARLK